MVAVMLAVSGAAFAVTTVIMPTENGTGVGVNLLYTGSSNYQGLLVNAGYLGGTIYRSLVYYDVDAMTAYLDANSPGWIISSATLTYAASYMAGPTNGNFSLHEMLVDYNFTEADWVNRKAGTPWGASGGQAGTDYNATPDYTFSWTAGYHTLDVTSAVQSWFSNPAGYDGWMLKGDDESSSGAFRQGGFNGLLQGQSGTIALTIIPEPGMMMLLGLGLTFLARKKK